MILPAGKLERSNPLTKNLEFTAEKPWKIEYYP
jgi:hypothetical protein